jgi:hypothetical protein
VGLTSDQLRGKVGILIDGEEKFLRFDQSALAKLIDGLGVEGLSNIPSAVASLDGKTLEVLVWVGRLWEEPDLTKEQVSDWFYPLLPTYNCALEAINLALWGELEPDFGGSDDDENPPTVEEIGTSPTRETLQ